MFIFALKSLLLICVSILLIACDGFQATNISGMCDEKPAICEDFHQIGDCRFLRTSVIRARYQLEMVSNEKNTIKALEELDAYKSCLELTLQIAYTRYKDRKQKRLDNYLASKKVIDQLLVKSVGTQDPNLAYFLWTNHNDLAAKQVFLNATNQPNISDISLLTKLAIYHTADEPQRAIQFFYDALQKTDNIEALPTGIFIQIIGLFYSHHLYQEAYIWSIVATETNQDNAPINIEKIVKKGYFSKQLQSELTNISEHYIEALEQGSFSQPAPALFKPLSLDVD